MATTVDEIFKDRVPSLKEVNSDFNQSEFIRSLWKQILDIKAAGGIDDKGIRDLIDALAAKVQELEEDLPDVQPADPARINSLFND